MLELRIELSERLVLADRNEHRVVAEAALPTRRPNESAVDPSVERFGLPVIGPRDGQRADEVGSRSGIGLGRLDLTPDPVHCAHPVAIAFFVLGPAAGEYAGAAV